MCCRIEKLVLRMYPLDDNKHIYLGTIIFFQREYYHAFCTKSSLFLYKI